jgi:hypothetical protein
LLFLPFLVLFRTNHLLKNGFSYILKRFHHHYEIKSHC